MTIKQRWDELTAPYDKDGSLAGRFFVEIEKKYGGAKRHYHNLQHIAALLQLSQQYRHLISDCQVMDFSIFYHDIIYNVLRKDNEPRSASVAVKRLQALDVAAGKTALVKWFIEATQTHRLPAGLAHTFDLELFLDFDMSILAAPAEQYVEYTRQVRREYRVYPDKLYIPGRRKFLQGCLQSAHIFHTSLFREQYEAIARNNMAAELEGL